MSACARHNQRSNSAVLNRIQITGLSAGQFPFGVPGSGEFRLHRLPGLRADLKDTLIFVFTSYALLRTVPLSSVSPRLPSAPLSTFLYSSLAVSRGVGGDRPAAPGSEAGLPAAPSPRRQSRWGSFCVLGKPPIWLITRSTPLSAPDSRPQTWGGGVRRKKPRP